VSRRVRPPFHSLRDFLLFLEQEGELRRIGAEVDPALEATEIAVRSLREGGPALLFEKPSGFSIPLVMNVLSSERRIELGLGLHPHELGQRLLRFAEEIIPPSLKTLRTHCAIVRRGLAFRPRVVPHAPAYETEQRSALGEFPVLTCWPGDGGRFITLPQVVTEDIHTHKRNIGMYRMQVFDDETTGMHWQIQKGGGFHYYTAEKQNLSLPAAVAIGTDPALLLATVAPLPEAIDEAAFAGFLRGERTRMTRARTVPLDVPAEAEIILEGIVPPLERRREGPFGDHFGHYSAASDFPVFHITRMAHRRNPIYAATVVGRPPMEDRFLGDATQEILGPLIKLIHPEITDLWAYYEAGFHNLLVLSVDERYHKEAMKTAVSIIGEGQLSLTKCVIVVDSRVNVRDFKAVMGEVSQWFDPHEDFLLLPRVPLDTLDFTSYTMNLGSKMVIDATRKDAGAFLHARPGAESREPSEDRTHAPAGGDSTTPSADIRALTALDSRVTDGNLVGKGLLILKVTGGGREVLAKVLRSPLPDAVKIVAAVGMDVDIHSGEDTIWGIFTRFDAERDVMFTRTELAGIAAVYGGVMAIDATWKPGYPEALRMPEEVIRRVDSRWQSLWR